MEALIIVAHGSKVDSSNQEIVALCKKIENSLSYKKDLIILYSFLELTEPSIFHTINKAISKKCKKIKIFPYFLSAGKHVKSDIPNEIQKFKKQNPEIEFILLPHFGNCEGVEEIIISNSIYHKD